MTRSDNPYQSPSVAADPPVPRAALWDRFSVVGWPVVYALNIIVPLMFGWGMTEQAGRVGMFVAMAVVLAGGWWLAPRHAWVGRRLIVGAVITALSQVIPILHIYIGMASIAIVTSVGSLVAGEPLDAPLSGPLRSETAGFAVTVLVGGSLIVCSLVFGLVLGLLLPRKWMMPGEDWAVDAGDSRI
ncbi:hypothetical protein Pla123a_38080 [Posidoniimonas polymericola]|uniref:Uncharacterized protein n=1 Tax=Posidoniimonas polymericola TaxID=2528002 RepID=A0A5C5YHW3_9BACT|nr:hypothetical protein [Posidoniimonas polymericola]TWT73472.1 hypothetical protein Pla123a_38080 [Posidoniimonas polymericola]